MIDFALRALGALVSVLPWRAVAPLGDALGFLVGSILRVRRRIVLGAMRRARIEEPAAHADAMYASLGRGVFELLWLAGARPARRARFLARHASIDEAALDAALARGPVVLCASHTGNWEIASAAATRVLALRGRRLFVVGKPLAVGGIDAFCARLRERLGVGVIRPSGAMTATRRALASGACVAMPVDQVPDREGHGLSATFLGTPALVDRAPAVLARRARATMLVVAASRRGAHHRVDALATIPPPRTRVEVEDAAASATAALDGFVRRSPSSWLWLHRRWRAPRGACPARSGALVRITCSAPPSAQVSPSR